MYLEVRQRFDLGLTLGIDQALRWLRSDTHAWHTGIAWGKRVRLRQTPDGDRVEFQSSLVDDSLGPMLHDYLCLDEDIEPTHRVLSEHDSQMQRLVMLYGGLRILRQEPWECLITYALSPRHKVERIRQAVEQLAEKFGQPIQPDSKDSRNAFPTPASLVESSVYELSQLKLGMPRHSPYVRALAEEVYTGSLDLGALAQATYGEAKERLMQSKGIGPKVADCVLLFSLGKSEAFPIDTHVRRALVRLYGLTGTDSERLEWAQSSFGPHAGYASQLLFHGMRNGAI